MLGSMAGIGHGGLAVSNGPIQFALIAAAYFVCICMPNVNAIFRHWKIGLDTYKNFQPWAVLDLEWRPTYYWAAATGAMLLVAMFVSLITGGISPFLYFQF
jgi:hypothetical protein